LTAIDKNVPCLPISPEYFSNAYILFIASLAS
jgi:hypothetical protein